MPALRQRLKRPETYLAAFFLLLMLVALDARRRPPDQVTGRLYIAAVRAYQSFGRPLLAGRIRCRYRPTCSAYSIEAVARHGIGPGLRLTFRRIDSCRTTVPFGTPDPVPAVP